MFDHFGKTAAQFAFGQGLQKNGVDEHSAGVSEHADRIFHLLKIDAQFAADGSIRHRKQGGWHLHKVNAAFPGSGTKSAHVSNYPATEIYTERFSVQFGI